MWNKVQKFIEQNQMIQKDDRVIAAVSGGADSVCLFVMLVRMAQRGDITLRALHVHHGIRGAEADRDAVFTKELCERFQIPCRIIRKKVKELALQNKMTLEEAGRVVRYQELERYAAEWDEEMQDGRACKIATAHHMGDNAETILYHMFRGSGLRGLSGITPVRGRIFRPLLCVEKEEITEFLKKESLEWCEDSTNQETQYMRNRIRKELLPWVKQYVNAEAVPHIVKSGERIAQAEDFLEYSAAKCYPDIVKKEKNGVRIIWESFEPQHPAIRSCLIQMALEEVCKSRKDIGGVHVEAVQELFKKQVGKELSLPNGIQVKRVYEGVWIKRESEKENTSKIEQIQGEQETSGEKIAGEWICEGENRADYYHLTTFCYEKGMEIPQNRYTKWFDYDKIKDTVSFRHRQSGDFITIKGGGKKSVKEYMIHEKIPREIRDSIDLAADGNHIMWIVGYRISEMYKVTEDTKTILQIQYDGGTEDGR